MMMYEFCCKFPSKELIPFLQGLDINTTARLFTEDWEYLTIEYSEYTDDLTYVGFNRNYIAFNDVTIYEVSLESFINFLESIEAYGYEIAKTMYKEEFTLNGKLLHY